jgi:hypothetical protein
VKRLLVVGLAVLAACDQFDELAEAALDAGRLAIDAGTMAGGMAGGTAGGNAGGTAGGTAIDAGVDAGVCGTACPPVRAGCTKACQTLELVGGGLSLQGPLLGLATTRNRLFLAVDGGSGFSVLHIVDGGVRNTTEFPDRFLDLDARFNEAALATNAGIWAFNGASWTSFAPPTGSASGGCQSVTVTGDSLMPSRRAYCRAATGAFGVTTLQMGTWGSTSSLGPTSPMGGRASPSRDGEVLLTTNQMGSTSTSFVFVPTTGAAMPAPLTGATSSAVASNDTPEAWVAVGLDSSVVLWPASGTPTGFPVGLPDAISITGSFTVEALAASGMPSSSNLAVALTTDRDQTARLQNQDIPLSRGTTVLLLRGIDVRVLPLGTEVQRVFLGFGDIGPDLMLHLGLTCSANGSLACGAAAGPGSRWVMLPVQR